MRLVVGMSGTSGSIYGIRLLELLGQAGGIETHLVVSRWSRASIEHEKERTLDAVHSLATAVYDISDLDAPIADPEFRSDGMIVAPCSVKSLSAIANPQADNLLSRAATMHLEQHRKLVLVLRETSLSLMHARLMRDVTSLGAKVMLPEDADDMVDHTVRRAIDQFTPITDHSASS
ncbi:UbiX family flavin prenyltransferase [Kibdelosporangium philippinense]|uniref:UbiX family flavin prenyltransferase n=1 Tax=Kibdelosporangium philippinense TaxID=211113 RepID=A0ABS8Z772_9PSEU|nr:UbiX family flavin prenyltransferase [Kibdelosporangium philippinense]MCE7002635.1 UbiX family flavin prenyltransferase [Kibdelosporangium philippinense]